jgi:hypothetical protein
MKSDPSIAPAFPVCFIIRRNVTAGNRLVTLLSLLNGLSKLLILFTKLASGIEAFR